MNINQLCKVCGEPAAGYHFGAFTCEGCKSFFGRTYNNLAALGECKNNGQCVINKKNRTSCKSCRLKKCLMVGMSKSGSRYGRRSNWFKIHCLIQDQADMTTRLSSPEAGNPMSHLQGLDNKEMLTLAHFNNHKPSSETSDSAATSPSDSAANGSSCNTSPLSTKNSTPPYSSYDHHKSSASNGFLPFDSASPPYERKENFGFPHHPLPLSPVSPLSPLNHHHHHNQSAKFLFQSHHAFHNAQHALAAKGLTGLPKVFGTNGSDLLAAGYPFARFLPFSPHHLESRRTNSSRELPVSSQFLLQASAECYADEPEQDNPIDLTIKKSQTLQRTFLSGHESDRSASRSSSQTSEVSMMDDDFEETENPRVHSPLDLTKKQEAVPC